jgi:hypothetical protein
MNRKTDYLGDPLPEGYEPWMCDICTAVCNYEAMTQCARTPDCGFYRDLPESNHGAFGFMIKTDKAAREKNLVDCQKKFDNPYLTD